MGSHFLASQSHLPRAKDAAVNRLLAIILALLPSVCWAQSSSQILPATAFSRSVLLETDAEAWRAALEIEEIPAFGTMATQDSTAVSVTGPMTWQNASNSALWTHNGSLLDTDANQFAIWTQEAVGVNLPASARSNVVWSMGINYNGSGGRLDSDDAALITSFENYYHQGGAGAALMEWHLQAYTEDDVNHRIISTAFPQSGAATGAELGFSCDTLTLSGWNGDAQIVGNWTTNSFTCNNSAYFAAAVPTSGTHDGKFFRIDVSGVADTDTLLEVSSATSVTGSVDVASFGVTASTGGTIALSNASTNASADAVFRLQTAGGSAGDARITMTNGVVPWSFGQDNSNGDRFGIYNSLTIGSAPALEFDSNLKAYFGANVSLSAFLMNRDGGTNGGISFNSSNRLVVGVTGTGQSGYVTLMGDDAGITSEASKYLAISGGTDIYIQIGGSNVAQWNSTGITFAAGEDIRAGGNVNLTAATELTIAEGVVTSTKSYHTIDTADNAASDELDSIGGGTTGDVIIIRAESDARTVIVKDATGNIRSSGDRTLDSDQDTMTLLFNGAVWLEVAFTDNGS
jgi:hypothetical protein